MLVSLLPNDVAGMPGVQFTRQEVEEVIAYGATMLPQTYPLRPPLDMRMVRKVADLVWVLCDGHVSVMWAIINFLSESYRDRWDKVGRQEMQFGLQSSDLIDFMEQRLPALPTPFSVADLGISRHPGHSLPVREVMGKVLTEVAFGAELRPEDVEARALGSDAIDLLTRKGYLYVRKEGWLCFASNMHRKVWLETSREEAEWTSQVRLAHLTVLETTLTRLNAVEMREAYMSGGSKETRVKKVQMLIYQAVCSCVPLSVLVTPEWPAPDGAGFVGIVLSQTSEVWVWKLEVDATPQGMDDSTDDGSDSVFYAGPDPTRAFEQKKHMRGFHEVLISIGGRPDDSRKDFQMCVTFSKSFTQVDVLGEQLYMNLALQFKESVHM